MNLKDKTIVVTGGGQGLGRVMATSLAARGARLALVDLDDEKLAQSVEQCEKAGGEARAYNANVTDETAVVELFNQVVSDFNSLDGLINNAGILKDGLLVKVKDGKMEKLPLKDWQAVIDVNLTGVFLCGREAAAKMVEQDRGGCILNISSISRAGNFGQSNYAAARAGVAALTVTWGRELARYGIRCAGIAPGVFKTDMVTGLREDALARLESNIPLGRVGALEEIGGTAIYLFENDFFTGRIIELDGGMRL